MKHLSIGRLLSALAALLLLAVVVSLAGPSTVLETLTSVQLWPLFLAFAAASAGVVTRGARLVFLLPPGRLGWGQSSGVAAAALIASMLLPARLGELSLPWLLRRVTGWQATAGLATLVAARVLDLAALGVWASLGLVLVAGLDKPVMLIAAALLLLPVVALPATLRLVDRVVTAVCAPRGGWWSTVAARVSRVVSAVHELRHSPRRVAAAAVCSLITWATIWVSTWYLLVAMGFHWSPPVVLAGSSVASLASIVPINLVANLGTLEAGWTAAFVWLGIPLEDAAASGVACHLWSLLFAGVQGGLAWGWVVLVAKPTSLPRS